CGLQRLIEIGDDVLGGLDADRETDQIVEDALRVAGGFGNAVMRGRDRLADQALDAAETRPQSAELTAINDAARGLAGAADLEREKTAEATHLSPGKIVLRMAFQPGVIDALDLRMLLQMA